MQRDCRDTRRLAREIRRLSLLLQNLSALIHISTPVQRTTHMSDYSTSRPWENEPDHVEFAHAGFSCVMRRGNHGAWLAYVILPPSHPLFGLPLEDDRLQQIPSHGEWTWATDSLPNKASKAQWVIGFHCAESTDYVPAMPPEMQALFNLMCPTREYRTAEYVQFTLKRACDALAKPFPVDSTNPLNPESTAQ